MTAALLASVILASAPRPVVVELFTSEGCSSCPPADELLRSLDGTAAVPGAEIIALGFHVDYWNRLGWKDPFSDADWSARQSAYAEAFGADSVYTPHLLVNGRTTSGGAIADAASSAKTAPLALSVSADGDVKVTVPQNVAGEVYVAVTEKNLESKVTAGENRGRTLQLAPVVRSLTKLGRDGTAHVKLPTDAKRGDVAVVAFVQARDLQIVAAARQAWPMKSN